VNFIEQSGRLYSLTGAIASLTFCWQSSSLTRRFAIKMTGSQQRQQLRSSG